MATKEDALDIVRGNVAPTITCQCESCGRSPARCLRSSLCVASHRRPHTGKDVDDDDAATFAEALTVNTALKSLIISCASFLSTAALSSSSLHARPTHSSSSVQTIASAWRARSRSRSR